MKTVNYRNSFFRLLALFGGIVAGLLYFNISSVSENARRGGEVEKLRKEMADARAQVGDIRSVITGYKEKTAALSSLAREFNTEIEYLASLEIFDQISRKHNVRIDEIIPRLENTLPASQRELTDPRHTVERYALDLRVTGRFLDVGRMLDDLHENDFSLRNLEVRTRDHESNVAAVIGLYSYRLISK